MRRRARIATHAIELVKLFGLVVVLAAILPVDERAPLEAPKPRARRWA